MAMEPGCTGVSQGHVVRVQYTIWGTIFVLYDVRFPNFPVGLAPTTPMFFGSPPGVLGGGGSWDMQALCFEFADAQSPIGV